MSSSSTAWMETMSDSSETLVRRRGPMRRVFVDRLAIDRNRREERNDPPLSVRRGDRVDQAHRIDILGADGEVVASIVHDPLRPLGSGATVWVETRAELRLSR